MRKSKTETTINSIEVLISIQFLLLGIATGEIFHISYILGTLILEKLPEDFQQNQTLPISIFSALIVLIYTWLRGAKDHLARLLKSRRIDLLALTSIGLITSIQSITLTGQYYSKFLKKIPIEVITITTFSLISIALSSIIWKLIENLKSKNEAPSLFINDSEISNPEQDLLKISDKAQIFAERVLNGRSRDSLIFGIDAPWGIGKSSYINFCCEHWKSIQEKVIVYRFEPLRYDESTNLIESLISDLIKTIDKTIYIPTLRPLLSTYTKLIKGKSSATFFGIKFEYEVSNDTISETIEKLESLLNKIDYKIIIIIDDLDRLGWPAAKNVLFSIKRSFKLPNVSYVICYDTEKIATGPDKDNDAEEVRIFLEKFINIKTSIFIDGNTLIEYITTNFRDAARDQAQIDPKKFDDITQTIEELTSIFKSEDLFEYRQFIGDIRKLKRLINTIMMLDIEKTDFAYSDLDKFDLLRLLLIYINYPNIFRAIHDTESNGKSGFFSLVPSRDSSSKFRNSEKYQEYINKLDDAPKLLVNSIFDLKSLNKGDETFGKSFTPLELQCKACFNGHGGTSPNLNRYLELIINSSKPQKLNSQKFYSQKLKLLQDGESLKKIISDPEIKSKPNDIYGAQLWNTLVNSIDDFNQATRNEILENLISDLPNYSGLAIPDIASGARDSLIYSITKTLNTLAESDETNDIRISEFSIIIEKIFSPSNTEGNGILQKLGASERGLIGIYDLLIFRLFCSPNRNNNFYNIHRALSSPKASISSPLPSDPDGAELTMRRISIECFDIFRQRYINSNKNIFIEARKITIDEHFGKSSKTVNALIEKDQNLVDAILERNFQILNFITYQLSNQLIESGVGCGRYMASTSFGERRIRDIINDYIFDFCLNKKNNPDAHIHLVEYLLSNLLIDPRNPGKSYFAIAEEFGKVLDLDKLKKYWNENKLEIQNIPYHHYKHPIHIKKNLMEKNISKIFKLLDDLKKDQWTL